MLKQLFEKASKAADQVEIYSVKVEKYPVNFTANKLKSIKSQLTRGTGLRIIKNGRLGFSSDTGTSNQENLIKRALASVKLGPPAKFDFCRDKDLTRVDLFDPRTVSFEIEEAVEMGQKMIDHVVKHDPDTVNEASVTRYFIEVTYISDGVEKTYYKTLLTRGIYSMKITGDGFIYVGQSDSSCRLPDDILALSRRIVRKLPYTEKVFQMPSKPSSVIFHPKAARYLVGPLVAGLSGSSLVSGTSPLIGRHNRWILDQRFTLADDPTIALGTESEGFDGEGIPRSRQVLFDHGVLSNYLLDLSTASQLDMEPNGCATRDINSPPSPGSSNLVVSGGDTPVQDMIEGIDDGLLVEEVIGGGQSNVIAGEFSMNVSLGFKIEKGKIVGRVRDNMVAGNVYELLKNNLEALTVETETHDSLTSPYFLFRDLSVSGKN